MLSHLVRFMLEMKGIMKAGTYGVILPGIETRQDIRFLRFSKFGIFYASKFC